MKSMNKSFILPFLSIFILALIVFFGSGDSQFSGYNSGASFASIENGAFSFSPNGLTGGLAIPASCESNYEHFPGECAPPPPPAPTVSLSANPTSIIYGQSSTLSWSSSNTTSCSLDQGIGGVPTSGSRSVSPANTTTYTLSCSGPGGSAQSSANVSVIPKPTVSLKASLLTVEVPNSINLSWSSTNADSCTASGDWSGGKSTNGSESITKPRGNYTFNLSCSGPGGQASGSQNVSVIQVPQCFFTASPSNIILPETSTLSWSCNYAGGGCTINQGIGSVSSNSGSLGVHPPVTTTYTLSCSGLDGSRSFTTTVGVGFIPKLKEILPK